MSNMKAFDPTPTRPGTEARMEIYAARLAELEDAGHRIDLLLGLDLPSIFVSGDDNNETLLESKPEPERSI